MNTIEDEKLISFAQFPLDEGGFVFCRISKFDKNLDTYNLEISEIHSLLH